MADDPVPSHLDLSGGESPSPGEASKANALLDDAASRRRYRRFSFFLAVVVVGFFGLLLFKLACAVITYVTSFSPWVVGMFATLVVAMSVITLALLKATFAAPGGTVPTDVEDMPQVSILSDALKAMTDAVSALRDAIGK